MTLPVNPSANTSDIAMGDFLLVGDSTHVVSSVAAEFDAVNNVNLYTVGVDSDANFLTCNGAELVVHERPFNTATPTTWAFSGKENIPWGGFNS